MTRKTRPPLQPRALGSDTQAIQPYYRASLYSELAKINRPDKTRQLLLGQGVSDLEINNKVSEYLPSFGSYEWLAFSAIQKFIDRASRQGESLDLISFTLPEFYQACNLSGASNHQKEKALDALRGFMTRPKKIIQKWRTKEGKKYGYELYILRTPLLVVSEGQIVKAESEEEADQIISQELAEEEMSSGSSKRQARIVVRPEKIFYQYLDSFHVKKSATQYEEIKALHPGEKAYTHSLLLTDTLQTLNYSPYKPSKIELAYNIGLKHYWEQRKTSIINSRIQEALQDAKKAGFLLDYYEDPIGYYVLELNPDKCLKYAGALKRKKKEAG